MTFEEAVGSHDFKYPEAENYADDYKAIFEKLKPRWIPVTERLPDKEGKYPMKFVGFDSFWIIDYKPGFTVFDGEITHWMDIPQ